jgi:hypothetical protein
MKTMFTTLALTVLTLTTARAQNEAMDKALNDAYAVIDTAMTPAPIMTSSAKFSLIAENYPDQWVAHYYAAYAKAISTYYMAENEKDKKDAILDEADDHVAKIKELGIENDHYYVISALVANARMAVDGENRWKKYGPIFEENLKKAKEKNENNPHIYYLKAVSLFYTPKMFGGGDKNAMPYFEKADGMYNKLADQSIGNPHWGKKQNDYYMGVINGTIPRPVMEEPKSDKKEDKKAKKN